MTWLYAVVAVLAGLSNPLQSGANSEFVKHASVVPSAFYVYATGAVVLLLAIPVFGFAFDRAKLADIPWWAWIGGLCNVTFLLATLTVTKKLGSALFTTLVVITAVCLSLALDHFGLMGFEQRTATAGRLLGGALAIAGIVCIARF